MEEIIDLLTAYYTALLEKGYINHCGRGTPLIKSDNPKYHYFAYLLAGPDWRAAGEEKMDRESVTRLIEDGYYFWVSVSDTPDTWNWVRYTDGHWEREADRKTIPENRMREIIRHSGDKLGLEIEPPASELSKAARLLDDEMQYEI